ncbi:MAG: flagellar hook associated protein, partial [Chloroflexota bacterium]
MDDVGDFVIVWQSYNQDNLFDIYAQRYNASGLAQGNEFSVNTYTTGDQTEPAVAMDADGDFVVVWRSAGQEGEGDPGGIYGQRYNASGTALG